MQNAYLLLRNNRESGPFTLQQLWQQQLRPSDMIWIEGKSSAWAYLSELELNMAADSVQAGRPAQDELESKAEALRKNALATPPHQAPALRPATAHRSHAAEETEEPIVFVDHRKEKNNILGEVLMTVFIVALLAGGLVGGRTWFTRKQASPPVITRMSSGDAHAAARPPALATIQKDTPVTLPAAPVPLPAKALASRVPARKDTSKKQKQPLLATTDPQKTHDSTRLAVAQQASRPQPAVAAAKKEEAPKKEEAIKQDMPRPAAPPAETVEPKRKTLGQAIKSLFHRKKKEGKEAQDGGKN